MILLAEFSTVEAAASAAKRAAKAGRRPRDVLSPIPLEGIAESLVPEPKAPIGWAMLVAGALGAGIGWSMQWYSAVIDYPILSGGRPLNSWPAFLLVPYEMTILWAGIVGLFGWMWMCGLPKLHHPLFAADVAERAQQDRFLLVFADGDATPQWIRAHLKPDALHEVGE